jgi:hypothetical protein
MKSVCIRRSGVSKPVNKLTAFVMLPAKFPFIAPTEPTYAPTEQDLKDAAAHQLSMIGYYKPNPVRKRQRKYRPRLEKHHRKFLMELHQRNRKELKRWKHLAHQGLHTKANAFNPA